MRYSVSRSFIMLIFIMLFAVNGFSQIKQGEWRDHLSYRQCYSLADAGRLMYCSSDAGMISYNRTTSELEKYSKVSGLSDVEVSVIAYDANSSKLLITYINGNIDIQHDDGTIVNLSDIKRKSITGSKRINSIHFHNEIAYLAVGFGVVALDMNKEEIKDSYFFGEDGSSIVVNDVTTIADFIYAATESGVYKADIANSNLVDYTNWHRIEFLPQFTDEYKLVENYNNELYAVYNEMNTLKDKIIAVNEDSYSYWNREYDPEINNLVASGNYLSICSPARGLIYDQNGNSYRDFVSYGVEDIYVDPEGEVFVAATYNGFNIQIDDERKKYLLIDGPRFNEVSKVATLGDHVWVSSGGPRRVWSGKGAAYSLIDNDWNSITSGDMPGNVLGNTYKIAIDPRDYNHVFAGTQQYGILEIVDGELIYVYTEENTPIFSNVSSEVKIRVSGIQYDSKNNLWMILDFVSNPIFIITNEGEWKNPEFKSNILVTGTQFTDLCVTKAGQIWLSTLTKGLIVIEGDGAGGYQEKTFSVKNQDGTVLSRVYCLEEDNEGNIWIGTNSGPAIYYSPQNIFNQSDVSAYQVKIPRDDGSGNADYLLFSEVILDIETNGGNQKWLATESSGAFLVSPDGKETLANYREENSKMLSNTVTGVGINEIDGEIFFATDKGLISLKGIATKGLKEYSNVYVYPNPVRPEYEGNITVTGLVENSIVKITDISGNLVYETNSLGGQAIWNGNNFDGRRVASGIYLVLVATPDGSQSAITKLLFLH